MCVMRGISESPGWAIKLGYAGMTPGGQAKILCVNRVMIVTVLEWGMSMVGVRWRKYFMYIALPVDLVDGI